MRAPEMKTYPSMRPTTSAASCSLSPLRTALVSNSRARRAMPTPATRITAATIQSTAVSEWVTTGSVDAPKKTITRRSYPYLPAGILPFGTEWGMPGSEDEVLAFQFKVWKYKEGELVALMVRLGDRLGISRALAAAGQVTSAELAERTGLQERWLREWLRGQAAAGLVDSADGE